LDPYPAASPLAFRNLLIAINSVSCNSGNCECQQMDTCHVIQYKVVTAGFGMESFSALFKSGGKIDLPLWMYVSP